MALSLRTWNRCNQNSAISENFNITVREACDNLIITNYTESRYVIVIYNAYRRKLVLHQRKQNKSKNPLPPLLIIFDHQSYVRYSQQSPHLNTI